MSVHRTHGGGPVGDPGATTPAADATPAADSPPAATSRLPASTGRADVMRRVTAAGTGGGGSTDPLKLIDAAKTRVFMKIPDPSDKNLIQHLKDAAARGVDVQCYMVAPKTPDGKAVLDEQGLEDSGVDTTVDRTDKLPGFSILADDQAVAGGAATSDPAVVSRAASAFAAAVREKAPGGPATIAPESVHVLQMPEATGAEIAGAIAGAKKSIDLEIYQLEDPQVTQALVDAAKRGVKVRVMLEPKTVGSQNFDVESKKLAAGGVDVKATPPAFDSKRNVDHAKFMVLDGKEMLYGTGNLVRSGLGGNPATEFDNRDFWVEDGRAQSASEAATLFQDDWDRKATTGVNFKNLVLTPDNADQRILDLIGGAKSRCFVWNQSLSDPKVIDALLQAKARGADVRVLLGYQPVGGGAANDPALKKLAAAGIPAAYYTRNYLHAKGIVADDKSYLGSQNFTNGGLVNNRELGEIFDDPSIAKELSTTFLADQGRPKP